MIRLHNIDWFLADPNRLVKMKPFTRGGTMIPHGYEGVPILNNTELDTGFASLQLHPISQDRYILVCWIRHRRVRSKNLYTQLMCAHLHLTLYCSTLERKMRMTEV